MSQWKAADFLFQLTCLFVCFFCFFNAFTTTPVMEVSLLSAFFFFSTVWLTCLKAFFSTQGTGETRYTHKNFVSWQVFGLACELSFRVGRGFDSADSSKPACQLHCRETSSFIYTVLFLNAIQVIDCVSDWFASHLEPFFTAGCLRGPVIMQNSL